MQQIYLDNASTTFPKPQAVADAVYHSSAARTAKMLSLRRTLPKA